VPASASWRVILPSVPGLSTLSVRSPTMQLSQALGLAPHTILERETGKANPRVLEIVAPRDVFGEEIYSSLARALAEE
jgi:hypothetical protein